MPKEYLKGKRPLPFVFWVTFFLPLFFSYMGLYTVYGLDWGVFMPEFLYEAYLVCLIGLYLFGAYVGSYAVIMTVFKQPPSIAVKYGALACAFAAILYLPARLILEFSAF
jgi:hypothetical protein